MKALIEKNPQPVTVDIKEWEIKIANGFKVAKQQMKRLSWLMERNPGFVEKHAFDEHLGLEVRRLRL